MSTAATILLDKERELRFRFSDELKLSNRLDGKGTGEILDRLNMGDPKALLHTMSIGLAHAERELETNLERVSDIIDTGLRKGTTKGKITLAVIAAFKDAGIIPKDKEDGAPAPTP
jgi:hypothetical protein